MVYFYYLACAIFYLLVEYWLKPLLQYHIKTSVTSEPTHTALKIRPSSGCDKLIIRDRMIQICEEFDESPPKCENLLIDSCKLDEPAFEYLVDWLKSNERLKSLSLDLSDTSKDICSNQLQSLLQAFKLNKSVESFMFQSELSEDYLTVLGKPLNRDQHQEPTIHPDCNELFSQIELALNPNEKKRTHFKYLFFQTRESEQRTSNVQFSFK